MIENKGITLIALVITIIVLLILASVSISMVLGNNGILSRAEKSKEETDLAREKENIDFSITSAYTTESLYSQFTLSSLQDSLNRHFGNGEALATENPDGSFTIKVLKSGNEYQMTNNGTLINVNKVKDKTPAELVGSGTEEDPFLIESIEDLIFFSYQVRSGNENYEGKYVELTTDLNFASSDSYVEPNCENYGEYGYNGKIKEEIDKNGFIPIGAMKRTSEETLYQKYFRGTFNGNYHKIVNLKIGGDLELEENVNGDIGFFTINFGTIKNLKLTLNSSVTLKTTNRFAAIGLLCGVVGMGGIRDGFIENCSVNGNVNVNLIGEAFNVGGLVGALNGTIKNCSSDVNLVFNGSVKNRGCNIGGISGAGDSNAEITNCYNTGNILVNFEELIGGGKIGGVLGNATGSAKTLNNIYNLGKIEEGTSTEIKDVILDECCGISQISLGKAYSFGNLVITNNKLSIIGNNFTKKSSSELKGQAGVELLNSGTYEQVWVEDTTNINNGFPILNWQVENN